MGAEKHPDDKIQSEGSKDKAAQHVNPAPDDAGAERYPSVKKDDAIDPGAERRSFEGVENTEPRRTDRDPDPSVNQGHMGPGGDPAEDKR